MLKNGADIRFIQALLGHADLSSAQIYTNVSILKLQEIHAATHPVRLERQARAPGTVDRQAEDRLAAAARIDTLGAEAEDERAHPR